MTRHNVYRIVVAGVAVVFAACTGPKGDTGANGAGCQVTTLDGGGARITCADGTTVVVPGGLPGMTGDPGPAGDAGADGASCTVVDNGDGTKTISCTDGTSVTVNNGTNGTNGSNGNNGSNGSNGANGLGVQVSNFHGSATLLANDLATAGKFPVNITVTSATADTTGKLTVNYQVTQTLSDGGSAPVLTTPKPQFNVAKLVPAAVGEASNHWVPYLTRTASVPADAGGYTNPPGTVVLQGYRENTGVWTNLGDGGYSYEFKANLATAAFANDAGTVGYDQTLTHRVAIMMGGRSGATGSAWFDFVPNGSAVTETRDIVETATCKQCHGNNFAFHGQDRTEVGVCVTCHNTFSTDAYSNNTVDLKQFIHNIHAGGEKASVAGADGILWDDPATSVNEEADNKPFYIGRTTQDWWKLEFPAVLANCAKCHQGTGANVDNWKTHPSAAACSSCHDNVADMITNPATKHGGGQVTDAQCTGCHPASGAVTTSKWPIETMHDWTAHDVRLQPEFGLAITMTPPGNGSYYAAGDKPAVTVAITDLDGGGLVDLSNMTADAVAEGCNTSDGGQICAPADGLFAASNFFVHGPRGGNNPVLTRAARAAVVATVAPPWNLSASGANLQVKFDQGYNVPATNVSGDYFISSTVTVPVVASAFASTAAATRDEAIAWLNANAAFAARGIAYADEKTGNLAIRSRNLGPVFAIQLQTSAVATALFGTDTTVHIPGGFTPAAHLAKLADGGVDDPNVTYSSTGVTYQLDDVADLKPGTYTVGLEVSDRGRIDAENFKVPSVAFFNFQVGTATAEKPVARNCSTCHESASTAGLLFDPSRHNKILRDMATDQCTECHDYQPQNATGATYPGALPIAKRVHAVHNGENLTYPNTTVGHADENPARNWAVLYPQDIRNCETCHVKGTTTGTWSTKASRLPCSGCHDSDAATAHIKLMTVDPTPNDPWSGDEVEACTVCH